MKFSKQEWSDLFIAWLAISVAFGNILNQGDLAMSMAIAGLTVGVGFLLHELAHKLVAQRFGLWAEFRAWRTMLVFAVLVSFLGFVFAAPGAVMIRGRAISRRTNGLIAAAGPATNIVLALFFLGLGVIHPQLSMLAAYGVSINAWLAVFNMLPFGPLDGKKVIRWNQGVFWALLVAGVVILFIIPGATTP